MHGGKIVVPYFLFLAVLVGGLSKVFGISMSMQGILIAMAIAAVPIVAFKLITAAIKRKMSSYGLTGRQWAAVAFGHSPHTIVDADPSGSSMALVRQDYDPYPVPYEYDDDDGLPDEIIEDNGLRLAETFQPSIQGFFGATVAIFGIRRSGKSNCLAVLIEAMAPYELPMLICDTKDEFAGLVDRKFLPHGFMAGAPGATANVPDEVRLNYVSVGEAYAFDFGKAIMDGHLQVVLNLKSYETDDIAARVMCGIIKGINAWQEARVNQERVPVEIALDEAHKWLPQQLSETSVSKDVQDLLHQAFFSTIVRLGGSNGLGLIVASQRISELDKRCLQSLWKFLFRQTETIDIKRYEVEGIPREEVLSLRQGECFIFSPLCLGFRVQMYAKRSPDLSKTPGLEQLAQHRQLASAKTDMLARRRSYTGQDDAVVETNSGPSSELSGELLTAWEWYCKGFCSGRKLAGAMGITPDRAHKLIAKLQAIGYAPQPETVG